MRLGVCAHPAVTIESRNSTENNFFFIMLSVDDFWRFNAKRDGGENGI